MRVNHIFTFVKPWYIYILLKHSCCCILIYLIPADLTIFALQNNVGNAKMCVNAFSTFYESKSL